MCIKVGLAVLIALETRCLDNIFQHATHVLVHVLHIQTTSLYGIYDILGLSRIARHHQVVASLYLHLCGQVGTFTYPVGHYDTLETPIIAQDSGQHIFVALGIETVNLVICRHDGPRIALTNDNLEALQVELTQGTLRHALVDLRTTVLL